MSNRASASRYARALFDVTDPAVRSSLDAELTGVAQLFAGNAELQAVFASPSVPPGAKRGVVQALIARGRLTSPAAKLLTLLSERDRLGLVADVAAVFHEIVLADQRVLQAEITTAVPLTEDAERGLQARLSAATSKHAQITSRVDPAIIGGIVARIGSTVYDGSLANQLARIRERLTAHR